MRRIVIERRDGSLLRLTLPEGAHVTYKTPERGCALRVYSEKGKDANQLAVFTHVTSFWDEALNPEVPDPAPDAEFDAEAAEAMADIRGGVPF